jgi:hypothetical protein
MLHPHHSTLDNPTAAHAGAVSTPAGRRAPRNRLTRALLTTATTLTLTAALTTIAPAGASAALAPAGHLSLHTFVPTVRFSPSENAECAATISEPKPACDQYQIVVTNTGSRPLEPPVTITDTVPAGLEILRTQFLYNGISEAGDVGPCETVEQTVTCTFASTEEAETLAPARRLKLSIFVAVRPGAPSAQLNTATATTAESPEATEQVPDLIGSETESFGPSALLASISGVDGLPDTQAGGHPSEFITRVDLKSTIKETPDTKRPGLTTVRDVKDVAVDLPLGFLGDALSTPQCTLTELAREAEAPVPQEERGGCPADTQVGYVQAEPTSTASAKGPIYNLVPEHGVAAEFGFVDVLKNVHVIYSSVAPTPAGYTIRATTDDVPQAQLTDFVVNFFGEPAVRQEEIARIERRKPNLVPHVPFFTNPANCAGGELQTAVHIDSWLNPGRNNPDGTPDLSDPNWASASTTLPAVTGCSLLRFTPEAFSVKPETATADASSGLSFDLKVPQSEKPETLGTPPLRDATVTLPAGVIVNPAAAGGLSSCSSAQIGWLGGSLTNFNAAAPQCPDSSKIGDVEVSTPLLANPLVGTIYLAAQNDNPTHSLLGGYIVINDPVTGTLVKIAGKLDTDPSTGQITGIFEENPQLPFSDLKLHFYGGTRGELATPEGCGTFTTTSDLRPWSAPESGPDATPTSSFQINSGCTPGFTPAFSAGATNAQAGAYSPFVLSFSRQDSERELSGLSVTLPPGLVGKLAGISKCTDAQLAAAAANPSGAAEQASPECPANSRIGSVQASAGVGSEPYTLGGTAYLTGPYKGAPFGVAVVVPALAGPFDLGNVVVRSKLNIDPSDAHVTVTADAFPTIIDARGADGQTDGFPIRMRSVSITMDRSGFTLNPTSCTPAGINATLTSTVATQAAVSSHFQVGSCASLAFKPSLAVTTAGQASKANGAGLDVKVLYPNGPIGSYANIRSVKVDLPKQLPSRLTTLQKACLAATFEANPANCPEASDVGTATATTPLLSVPLMGPAYIVSHGNEAFPDLEIVLQGEGITLILDGNTQIKKGITSSTFKTVPDAPVSSFELKLHTGKYSILGANVPQSAHYSLCGQTLNMPTEITAQNGAVIKPTTKIAVTGCAKKKALTRAQKLTAALKACKKQAKGKQTACKKVARQRFGPVKRKKG